MMFTDKSDDTETERFESSSHMTIFIFSPKLDFEQLMDEG